MNIMGQSPTTANAAGEPVEKLPDSAVIANLPARSEGVQAVNNEHTATSNAANVIPTSPQYGVAIIPNNATVSSSDTNTETTNVSKDTVSEAPSKTCEEVKEVTATPSRNDRFKVVKIASLEPFKRGRWKCMDYVDEAPPPNIVNVNANKGSAQSMTNPPVPSGVFMQSQSLPQQQIQQMLIQGGYTNGTQFYSNVPTQMIPQGQYFYPQVPNMQNQSVPQQVATSMPTQFINNQPYFPPGVMTTNPAGYTMPQSYPNIQYVPVPTQNSAFVPTNQQQIHLPANFQSQSYSSQPSVSVSQPNVNQNMVNGHAYPSQQQHHEPSQQMPQGGNLPNQPMKNMIVNTASISNQQQYQQQHQQQLQQQHQQQLQQQHQQQLQQQQPPPPQQNHVVQNHQQVPQANTGVVQPQQYQQVHTQNVGVTYQQQIPNTIPSVTTTQVPVIQGNPSQPQPVNQQVDNHVNTNPQYASNANSATKVVARTESIQEVKEAAGPAVTPANVAPPTTTSTVSSTEIVNDNSDDPTKSNPVVNAIDNKIEQAMDLVKSHLMYTVREEVEVLKEKIAELMEKIQQLETENNYLRSQIPKGPTVNLQTAPQQQPSNVAVVNPSPNVMPQNAPINPTIVNPQVVVVPQQQHQPQQIQRQPQQIQPQQHQHHPQTQMAVNAVASQVIPPNKDATSAIQ